MTILFYPEKPKNIHVLYKLCKNLGWHVTNNLSAKYYVAIFFEDITLRPQYPELEKIAEKCPIINFNCHNISKEHIDRVFKEVFGYEISINPLTHTGTCVRKSNINAVHDGLVIDCPIENTEEGYVYQKLINSETGDGRVMDIRIPIFGDSIPFVLKRYKDVNDIFDITTGAEFANTDELLSKDEQNKVIAYCKQLGLDYGELDALRSNEDGKIYIVDANNTPAGPIGPIYKSKETYKRWLRETSDAFSKYFLKFTSA